MKLSSLGELVIMVSPIPNESVMAITIAAQNRKEPVHMKTNPDETADQFCIRLRGMMRALMNGEQHNVPVETPESKKEKTWDEQKAAMKKEEKKPNV